MSSQVQHITTEADFNQLKADTSKQALIVDFNAQWCGPCQRIKPHFESLAEKYGKKVHFASIDIDNDGGISDGLNINSVPTFSVFKNGVLAATIVGGDPGALTALVEKHAE